MVAPYLLPEFGLLRNGNAFPNRPPLASFASTPSAPNLRAETGPVSGRFGPPRASSA